MRSNLLSTIYRNDRKIIQQFKFIFKSKYPMNIKCITYSRYSTSIPIYTINQQTSNKTISTDAQKMGSKIKALRSKIDERQKLRTSYGIWFVTHDDNDICYGVCTDDNYPERHAFGLIEKLKNKIKQINHCEYQTQQNIKTYTKKTANELAHNYDDLSKIDKLHKANSEVKQLQSDLNVGIKKMINNKESLDDMDEKADKMKSYANQFHTNSEKLQRMLYWRNMKIKIIVALCIIGIIGFVILMIVQATSGSDNNSD